METSIDITVYADADYKFVASVSDEISLEYVERGSFCAAANARITFGSLEEMEAVGNAMLQAVKTYRKMQK